MQTEDKFCLIKWPIDRNGLIFGIFKQSLLRRFIVSERNFNGHYIPRKSWKIKYFGKTYEDCNILHFGTLAGCNFWFSREYFDHKKAQANISK